MDQLLKSRKMLLGKGLGSNLLRTISEYIIQMTIYIIITKMLYIVENIFKIMSVDNIYVLVRTIWIFKGFRIVGIKTVYYM